jgi:flagellar basal body-associated protein FliL
MKGMAMEGMGKGRIAVLIALVTILFGAGVWAITFWNETSGVEMSKHGWIALGLGTFFSLVIGCGLMALMFFSSRSGHDEAADPFRKHHPPST